MHSASAQTYSYTGVDFPIHFPLHSRLAKHRLPSLNMVFQESPNYPLIRPYSNDDDAAIYGPLNGIVRLGPMKRAFFVAMWHELHCVDIFRLAFEPSPPAGIKHHVHHCLSYLRQIFLCDADLTLEPRDFLHQNFTMQRTLPPRQCQDWGSLYSSVEANFVDWKIYTKDNVCTTSFHPDPQLNIIS
jgi:hypothetical protein